MEKKRAERNRTLVLSDSEVEIYSKRGIQISANTNLNHLENKTIFQDFFEAVNYLPEKFVDLLILDPPYNLNKKFNSNKFSSKSISDYSEYLENIIIKIFPLMKDNSSIYICGDWKSSISIPIVLSKYFKIRNRITWEREKGRGAKSNWKNNTEDIWFATKSDEYYFNPEAVKLKRKVLAPYKNENGEPKDWIKSKNGDYRLTYASNIWTDITIPFWSMPENTNHPTQKPEKLIAKLILASSKKGDFVFDPFSGSGTTSVVAKKLERKYLGIESDKDFVAITEKRIKEVNNNSEIQGYKDNVFWERNSLTYKKKEEK